MGTLQNHRRRFGNSVTRQVRRLDRAKRERRRLFPEAIYLGTLGLVLVLPVVIGAYLGRWLDGLSTGYSIRWTLSFLFLGLVIGVWNVWQLIHRHED